MSSRAARSASTPQPVWALSGTALGKTVRSRAICSGEARSALFRAISSGMSEAPSIVSMTARTACTWETGSGWAASTTCRMTSACPTSSRVERKASTSCVGRLRTKPTVSVSVYSRPSAARARRTVGSRVANKASWTRTPASVRRLSSVDLPAFVYPAMATDGTPPRRRELRCVRRAGSIRAMSARSFAMRVRMRRRSSSILVSPGPLEPIPAPPATRPPA